MSGKWLMINADARQSRAASSAGPRTAPNSASAWQANLPQRPFMQLVVDPRGNAYAATLTVLQIYPPGGPAAGSPLNWAPLDSGAALGGAPTLFPLSSDRTRIYIFQAFNGGSSGGGLYVVENDLTENADLTCKWQFSSQSPQFLQGSGPPFLVKPFESFPPIIFADGDGTDNFTVYLWDQYGFLRCLGNENALQGNPGEPPFLYQRWACPTPSASTNAVVLGIAVGTIPSINGSQENRVIYFLILPDYPNGIPNLLAIDAATHTQMWSRPLTAIDTNLTAPSSAGFFPGMFGGPTVGSDGSVYISFSGFTPPYSVGLLCIEPSAQGATKKWDYFPDLTANPFLEPGPIAVAPDNSVWSLWNGSAANAPGAIKRLVFRDGKVLLLNTYSENAANYWYPPVVDATGVLYASYFNMTNNIQTSTLCAFDPSSQVSWAPQTLPTSQQTFVIGDTGTLYAIYPGNVINNGIPNFVLQAFGTGDPSLIMGTEYDGANSISIKIKDSAVYPISIQLFQADGSAFGNPTVIGTKPSDDIVVYTTQNPLTDAGWAVRVTTSVSVPSGTTTSSSVSSLLIPIVTVAPALTRFEYDKGVVTANWTVPLPGSRRIQDAVLQVGGTTNRLALAANKSQNEWTGTSAATLEGSPQCWIRATQGISVGPTSNAMTAITAKPVIGTILSDYNAHTASFRWSPITNPPELQYLAELGKTGQDHVLDTQNPATSPATFTNNAITEGTELTVRVRAYAGSVYGPWDSRLFLANGVPRVSGVRAGVDVDGNISVQWAAVTDRSPRLQGATYTVQVVPVGGASPAYTQQTGLTGTRTQLHPGSPSSVQSGNQYQVSVQAQAPNLTAGPWSEAVTVTIGQIPSLPQGHTQPVADPIHPGTGAYMYENDDLVVGGVVPLVFTTYYRSDMAPPPGVSLPATLGKRWNHRYNTVLATTNGTIYILWGNGQIESFSPPTSGSGFCRPVNARLGIALEIRRDGSAWVVLADRSRFVFSPPQQSIYQLQEIGSPIGNRVTLHYANGKLQTVTDEGSGHQLAITYNGGNLSTVSDGTRTIAYTVNAGSLQVKNQDGNSRTFTYTDSTTGLIYTITDFNGVIAVKNQYDSQNRIIQQWDARGLAASPSYSTNIAWSSGLRGTGVPTTIATITDRDGFISVYESITSNGAILSVRRELDLRPAGSTTYEGLVEAETYKYDGSGNLTSKSVYRGPSLGDTSASGNTIVQTFTQDGQLESQVISLPQGKVFVRAFQYSAGNIIKSAVYEGPALTGGSTAFTSGNMTSFDYYDDGALKEITDPLGNHTSFTYLRGTIPGLVQTTTDILGNVFRVSWQSGMLATVTDPYGNVTGYSWDEVGRLQQLDNKDNNGNTVRGTKFTYNNGATPSTVGQVWYPSSNQPFAQAYTTTWQYDANGNPTRITDPTKVTVTLGYDPNNNLISKVWPQGGGTTRSIGWGYDKNDFVSQITSPATGPALVTTNIANDALGLPVALTDALGNHYKSSLSGVPETQDLTRFTTWPQLTVDSPVAAEITTYDPLGRVLKFIDKAGHTTEIEYSTNRQTQGSSATLQLTRTIKLPQLDGQSSRPTIVQTFDALGRLISEVDVYNKTWTTGYAVQAVQNSPSVMTATLTDPLSNQTIEATDSLGRPVGERQGANAGNNTLWRIRQYQYDAISRLTQVTEQEIQGANNAVVDSRITGYSYGYDTSSNCITATIGRTGSSASAPGATVLYVNGRGEVVQEQDPFSSNLVVSTYTPWGALGSYQRASGQTFTCAYDSAGQLLTTSYLGTVNPPAIVTLTQVPDKNGNRTATTSTIAGSRISREFDNWNRRKSRTDAAGRTVGYEYLLDDLVKKLTYPDGKELQYEWDALGRLRKATDWKGRTTVYDYATDGSQVTVTYNGAPIVAAETPATPRAIAQSTFTFDSAGRATGYSHRVGQFTVASATYQLDPLGQQSTANVILPLPPTRQAESASFTFNDGNQIVTINGSLQTSDADGDWVGPGSTDTAQYDRFGRLIEYTNSRAKTTYAYDLDGLRVSRQTGDISATRETHVFDIAGWISPQVQRPAPWQANGASPARQPALDRLLVSYDATNNVTARYAYGNGLIGGEDASGNYRVALTDLTGNVIAVVDETGNIVERAVYDPYGPDLGRHGNSGLPFRYNGRDGVIDDGTGILHMRARAYSLSQRRFLQPDPLLGDLTAPQSLNLYAFVDGNPIQFNDPLGLAATSKTKRMEPISSSLVASTGSIVASSSASTSATGAVGGFAGTSASHAIQNFLAYENPSPIQNRSPEEQLLDLPLELQVKVADYLGLMDLDRLAQRYSSWRDLIKHLAGKIQREISWTSREVSRLERLGRDIRAFMTAVDRGSASWTTLNGRLMGNMAAINRQVLRLEMLDRLKTAALGL